MFAITSLAVLLDSNNGMVSSAFGLAGVAESADPHAHSYSHVAISGAHSNVVSAATILWRLDYT